jgi:hypothetical protein
MNVTDVFGVKDVWIIYRIGSDDLTNITLGGGAGPEWNHTFQIPSDRTGHFVYQIGAADVHGNWNLTDRVLLMVRDNDRPEIHGIDSDSIASTGDPFWFRVNVTDNIDVEEVWVEYWWENLTHLNETMVQTNSPQWTKSIMIPHRLDSMHFIFHVIDRRGNYNNSTGLIVHVIDNDPPSMIVDLTPETVSAGEMFNLSIRADDNIEVDFVTVEVWSGMGSHMNLTLVKDELDTWATLIQSPIGSLDTIWYIARIGDTSNNTMEGSIRSVRVVDTTPPRIVEDLTDETGIAGRTLEFLVNMTDNLLVTDVWIQYQDNSGTQFNLTMVNIGDGLWSYIAETGDSIRSLTYRFIAGDSSFNLMVSKTWDVFFIDIDKPGRWTDSSDTLATTGDPFQFSIEVGDNWGVSEVHLEYWYGEGNRTNDSMSPDGLGIWVFGIDIPNDIKEPLNYQFHASDESGNWDRTPLRAVEVHDNDSPNMFREIHPERVEIGRTVALKVRVFDNIMIESVWVIVEVPYSEDLNLSMVHDEGFLWHVEMIVGTLGFYTADFWTIDRAGNVGYLSGPEIFSFDGTPPTLGQINIDPSSQWVGQTVNISLTVEDMDEVAEVLLRLEDPIGRFSTLNLNRYDGDVWIKDTSYNEPGVYEFTIIAKDNAGNRIESSIHSFEMKIKGTNGNDANGSPSDGDNHTLLISVTIGIIIVIMVFLLILGTRRKRNTE